MTQEDDADALVPRQMELQIRRYELLNRLVPVLWIVSLWVPLQAIIPIANAFAGRDTNVTVTISVTIALTIALGAGVVALLRRSKEQRAELQRLRRRQMELERELDSMRQRQLSPPR